MTFSISSANGRPIQKKTAPDWLMRPGRVECGERWPLVRQIYRELTGSELPDVMPEDERRQVDGILKCPFCGPRIIEVDARRDFNCYRGVTLRRYATDLRLSFDPKIWIEHSQTEPRQKSEGGRHRNLPFSPMKEVATYNELFAMR